MNIREGTELRLSITRTRKGYRLQIGWVTGGLPPRVVSTKTVASVAAAMLAIARWADDQVAKIGLAQTE